MPEETTIIRTEQDLKDFVQRCLEAEREIWEGQLLASILGAEAVAYRKGAEAMREKAALNVQGWGKEITKAIQTSIRAIPTGEIDG